MRFYCVKGIGGSGSYIDDWVSYRSLRLTPYTEFRRMSDAFILGGLSNYGNPTWGYLLPIPDLTLLLLGYTL